MTWERKYVGRSTKYKYVSLYKSRKTGETIWQGCIDNIGKVFKGLTGEHDAALFIDKHLISLGKEPVNILKHKLN